MELSEINQLYLGSDLSADMIKHKSRGLIIPFDPSWKNIAVNVSGGADSAMMASTLAQIISENNYECKIHFISLVRVWEFRSWAPFISMEVYEKIKSMFPTAMGNRIEGFIPTELEEGVSGPNLLGNKSGDRIIVNSFNKYLIYKLKLDALYNATTLNPEDDSIGITGDLNKRPRDRELDTGKHGIDRLVTKYGEKTQSGKSFMLYPFRYVDKRFVVDGYFKNNWQDLFQLTRSCEGDVNTHPELFVDYKEYKHGETELPLCGSCFWCLERDWAMEQVESGNTYET